MYRRGMWWCVWGVAVGDSLFVRLISTTRCSVDSSPRLRRSTASRMPDLSPSLAMSLSSRRSSVTSPPRRRGSPAWKISRSAGVAMLAFDPLGMRSRCRSSVPSPRSQSGDRENRWHDRDSNSNPGVFSELKKASHRVWWAF